MTTPPVRVVAFDVMDTLLVDPFREALRAATDLSPREFFARRDPDLYPAFERGEIDETAYWQRHRELGLTVDPEAFHRVRRERIDWVDGIPELLDELDGELRLVTASNYPVWIEELADRFLAAHFSQVLASCHLGVRKPEPAFFEALLVRVGARVEETLFVDDREGNVEGARAVGLRAHHFTGVSRLRHWLHDEGVAVATPS